MELVRKVFWVLFAGIWLAAGYLFAAAIGFVLVGTARHGRGAFAVSNYAVWPFRTGLVRTNPGEGTGTAADVLWWALAGWWLAVLHALAGVLLAVTVVGIPYGRSCFAMARLAFAPGRLRAVPYDDVSRTDTVAAPPLRPDGGVERL